jgi:hypothetical protein
VKGFLDVRAQIVDTDPLNFSSLTVLTKQAGISSSEPIQTKDDNPVEIFLWNFWDRKLPTLGEFALTAIAQ